MVDLELPGGGSLEDAKNKGPILTSGNIITGTNITMYFTDAGDLIAVKRNSDNAIIFQTYLQTLHGVNNNPVCAMANLDLLFNQIDQYGRPHIWFKPDPASNPGVGGIIRMGASSADGDPSDIPTDGLVGWFRTAPYTTDNWCYRIKANRIGLTFGSDTSLYYFRADNNAMWYRDFTSLYPAVLGDYIFYVKRSTKRVAIGNSSSPGSKLHVIGPIQTVTQSVNANTVMGDEDSVIFMDASGGARQVTLPAAAASMIGRVLHVYKTDNSGNAVTIVGTGGDTVNGLSSITRQWECLKIICYSATSWIATICAVTSDPPAAFVTPEGGYAVRLINKTGAASVKGSMVIIDSANNNSFILTPVSSIKCIGIVYDNGIADGSYCYVVVSGIADVLFEDGVTPTRQYWLHPSPNVAGRADNKTDPASASEHWEECGHVLESKSSGTNILAKCIIHFN